MLVFRCILDYLTIYIRVRMNLIFYNNNKNKLQLPPSCYIVLSVSPDTFKIFI